MDKVLAYITCEGHVVVFRHVDVPSAGLQVPGGTMEAGEGPIEAALREAAEETGLASLEPVSVLGHVRLAAEETGRRHYVQLAAPRRGPRWRHWELTPFDGGQPLRFELEWMPIQAARRQLVPGHGEYLDRLVPHRRHDAS